MVIMQMLAYICIVATGQCSNDILASPQVPITVRYASNPVMGYKNVSEFVASLATRPREGERLVIKVRVYGNVDPLVKRKLQDADIANSGKIGDPYITVYHSTAKPDAPRQ